MATVVIVDYDPSWPDQFEQLAAALRPRLGDAAVAIDHIGSTSVPGLAAKDIIDIQVTVASLADADRLGPAFQQAGYAATRYRSDHRPAGDSSDPALWEKRLWQSPSGARRRVNLVVYTDLKDHACDLIVVAAEEWAAGGRLLRRPDPSDSP